MCEPGTRAEHRNCWKKRKTNLKYTKEQKTLFLAHDYIHNIYLRECIFGALKSALFVPHPSKIIPKPIAMLAGFLHSAPDQQQRAGPAAESSWFQECKLVRPAFTTFRQIANSRLAVSHYWSMKGFFFCLLCFHKLFDTTIRQTFPMHINKTLETWLQAS